MLEDRVEAQLAEQFEHLLAFSIPKEEDSQALRADLQVAEQLKHLNLSAESRVRARLRAQLAQKMPGVRSVRNRALAPSRVWAGAILALLLLLLFVSNTPVRAALERWLGYGYLPYAGFIPLADTLVIRGPVAQSEQGWDLTILQGIQNQDHTVLWIGTNLQADAFSAAELALPDGARLPVRSLQPGPETIRLVFDALPPQTARADLALPGGWRLPVSWIPADQAGLAPTQVSTPLGDNPRQPCVDLENEMQLCAQAAFTDPQGTHLLLQAFQSGQPAPLAWSAASNWQSIALEGPRGRFYRIERFEQSQTQDPSVLSMRFSQVPAEVDTVTLHLSTQVLALPGDAAGDHRVIELPLHLPDRVPVRSPTPGVAPASPGHPIAVPTPAANRPPLHTTQP